MGRLNEILSRQKVERVVPPSPWWSRFLVVTGGIVLSWFLILLLMGGLLYWMDFLAEWWA